MSCCVARGRVGGPVRPNPSSAFARKENEGRERPVRHPPRVVLTIEDDGVGFDPTAVKRGNGLTNVEERARRLGGELRITERGTTTLQARVTAPPAGVPIHGLHPDPLSNAIRPYDARTSFDILNHKETSA